MPLPNIITSGLTGFWHPSRVDRFNDARSLNGPYFNWVNILGKNILTSSRDLTLYATGKGTLENPNAFAFRGDSTTFSIDLSSSPSAYTATLWFKITPQEHNGVSQQLLRISNVSTLTGWVGIDTNGYLNSINKTGTAIVTDGNIHCVSLRMWFFNVGGYSSGGCAGDIFLDGQLHISSATFRQTNSNTDTSLMLAYIGPFAGTIYSCYTHNRKLSDTEMLLNYQAGHMIYMQGIGAYKDFKTDLLSQLKNNFGYISLITSTYNETQRVAINLTSMLDVQNMVLTIPLSGSQFSSSFPLEAIGANFYKDSQSDSPILSVFFEKLMFLSSQDSHNLFLFLKVV